MKSNSQDPLAGISEQEREIMGRLLRLPPERQKAAPKPATAKGEAQRRRREKESNCGDFSSYANYGSWNQSYGAVSKHSRSN